MQSTSELLRQAMRHWTTGVSIVTSRVGDYYHGMTVNSFTSISLDPPRVVVTLANQTRTCKLVRESRLFGLSILGLDQQEISDRFAGRIPEDQERFTGLEVKFTPGGLPLLNHSLADLECRVVHTFEMPLSTLFVGEVLWASSEENGEPLVYHNRSYRRLKL